MNFLILIGLIALPMFLCLRSVEKPEMHHYFLAHFWLLVTIAIAFAFAFYLNKNQPPKPTQECIEHNSAAYCKKEGE